MCYRKTTLSVALVFRFRMRYVSSFRVDVQSGVLFVISKIFFTGGMRETDRQTDNVYLNKVFL